MLISETILSELDHFLTDVDRKYCQEILLIPLFNLKKKLSKEQKKRFAGVFYHLRGHFINFLWYLGNFSESAHLKEIIFNNIREELGVDTRFSHEKLYERFAIECGIDIHDEIVNQTHYLPFAREFNRIHLNELARQDQEGRIVMLAAYERLDNIDYFYLTKFAETLGISFSASAFFRVHLHVEHFQPLRENLDSIWRKSADKIEKNFAFIYSHQRQMWQKLSHLILN